MSAKADALAAVQGGGAKVKFRGQAFRLGLLNDAGNGVARSYLCVPCAAA